MGRNTSRGRAAAGRSKVSSNRRTNGPIGWSANVEALVSELAEANSNQKRSAVVVLADAETIRSRTTASIGIPPRRPKISVSEPVGSSTETSTGSPPAPMAICSGRTP